MHPRSALLLPPRRLAGCIFAAIVRDTRGVSLRDEERFNHFPASPLVAVTTILQGDLKSVPSGATLEVARKADTQPRQSIFPAQDTPITSWSPGPVAAVTVGFFPEAWEKLQDKIPSHALPEMLCQAFPQSTDGEEFKDRWVDFCDILLPIWAQTRASHGLADWSGSRNLTDWTRSVLARAALAGPGRSMRAVERRLKRWSSQSRRSLKFYSDIDNLHRLATKTTDAPLAALASDAGYSDQSHMGRAVRRATGFSPAHLNRLIDTEEAFWCYRLLGERF